ncbi:hypothetical protein [Sphingomonas sp.]|uniref:hypothetical protein n=1 Tax=Sphingomonas sp. TaxID=28214 RepID=UPI002FD92F15
MQDHPLQHRSTAASRAAVLLETTARRRRAIAAPWLLGASWLLSATAAHAQQMPLPPAVPAEAPVLVPPPLAKPPSEKASFAPCDGYETPDKTADNYIHGSGVFGLVTATNDYHQDEKLALGANGVVACDVALASPLLRPEFTQRRHHLLIAKAMHLIAAGRPRDALPVLDAARAVPLEASAPLRARSSDIEEKAVRAYALIKLGDTAAAAPMIEEIAAARPYATSIQGLADTLRATSAMASGKTAVDVRISGAHHDGALDPNRLPAAMLAAFDQGRMEDVVKLGNGLVIAPPRPQSDWKEIGGLDKDKLLEINLLLTGITAYAEAVIGKTNEAQARFARFEQEIDRQAALPLPPNRPGFLGIKKGKTILAEEAAEHEAYGKHLVQARAGMENWKKLVALRATARTLPKEEVAKELGRTLPQAALVIPDVLAQAPTLDNAEGRAMIASLRKGRAAALPDFTSPAALMRLLPRPEMPEVQPKSSGPRTGAFNFKPTAGATLQQIGDSNRWEVHFSHKFASAATVEEISLMNATLLAKEKGCSRILLESRRTIERQVQVGYASYYDGRDSALRVWLVCDDKPLPPELAGAEWREMAVDPIYDRLTVQYADILPEKQTAANAATKP